jgi:hypothetical protein
LSMRATTSSDSTGAAASAASNVPAKIIARFGPPPPREHERPARGPASHSDRRSFVARSCSGLRPESAEDQCRAPYRTGHLHHRTRLLPVSNTVLRL